MQLAQGCRWGALEHLPDRCSWGMPTSFCDKVLWAPPPHPLLCHTGARQKARARVPEREKGSWKCWKRVWNGSLVGSVAFATREAGSPDCRRHLPGRGEGTHTLIYTQVGSRHMRSTLAFPQRCLPSAHHWQEAFRVLWKRTFHVPRALRIICPNLSQLLTLFMEFIWERFFYFYFYVVKLVYLFKRFSTIVYKGFQCILKLFEKCILKNCHSNYCCVFFYN